MNSTFLKALGIGVIHLAIFAAVFFSLQHKSVYEHTLGKVALNYERTGTWDNYTISKVSKPYLPLTNEGLNTWDAAIYRCIKERMYTQEDACFGRVRGAFFPLFPLIWRLTGTTGIGISVINFFLFIIAIALLVTLLWEGSPRDKLLMFTLLISVPSAIIYYIPYTEAVFLLSAAIAIAGIAKNRYWLFFLGTFLLAASRPAALFVLLAFLATELAFFFYHKNFRFFLKSALLKILPYGLGFLAALFFQYAYTHSWATLRDAQMQWPHHLESFKSISDWSVEGFGLSLFALFFIAMPALVHILAILFKRNKPDEGLHEVKFYPGKAPAYLFFSSCCYVLGIALVVLLVQGGSLHGLFRFLLASPAFYVILLILPQRLAQLRFNMRPFLFIVPLILLAIFLKSIEYGGPRKDFSFFGLYLSIVIFGFYLYRQRFSFTTQGVITFFLAMAGILWNTYMLNIMLSDAWIYT